MKTVSISIGLVFILFSGVMMIACQPDENPQLTAVCQLTSTNDQAISQSGQLTDELKRTFTYANSVLTGITEISKNGSATFQITYVNNRPVQAVSGQDTLTLTYAATASIPASATFSQSGKVHSTFVMEYDGAGRMISVLESRQVLVPNSLITQRTFTFSYDNAGNLLTEQTQFRLVGNVLSGQEVTYTFGQQPSPYVYAAELPLLTLVSLSQAVETKPGRFWQRKAPTGYQLYNLNTDGSRANLIDASTFTSVLDSSNKRISQDQTALLYTGGIPTPITKTNRQTFGYQCQ